MRKERAAELQHEVVERYRRGERHVLIAEALGISRARVGQICRAAGLSRAAGVTMRAGPHLEEERRRRLEMADAKARVQREREDVRSRVVELYKAGRTHAEIAEELGIHRASSAKIARRAGLGVAHGTKPRKASSRT